MPLLALSVELLRNILATFEPEELPVLGLLIRSCQSLRSESEGALQRLSVLHLTWQCTPRCELDAVSAIVRAKAARRIEIACDHLDSLNRVMDAIAGYQDVLGGEASQRHELILRGCHRLDTEDFLQSLHNSTFLGELRRLEIQGLGWLVGNTPSRHALMQGVMGHLQSCLSLSLLECFPTLSIEAPLRHRLTELVVVGEPLKTIDAQTMIITCRCLQVVHFRLTQFQNQLAYALAALPGIRSITLEDSPTPDDARSVDDFSDIGFAKLAQCAQLQQLSISRRSSPLVPLGITDIGLMLADRMIPRLTSLVMYPCPKITDAGVQHIMPDLARLEVLELRGCMQLQNPFVAVSVRRMRSLQSVHIHSSPSITDDTVTQLCEGAPMLEKLVLPGCRSLGDGCSAAIAALSDLRTLVLNTTMISDAGVIALASASKLQGLCLRGCLSVEGPGLLHLLRHLGGSVLQLLDVSGIPHLPTAEILETIGLCQHGLRKLRVPQCAVLPDLLRHLCRLPRLEYLQCGECHAGHSQELLTLLERPLFPSLRHFELTGSTGPADKVAWKRLGGSIQNSRPGLNIIMNSLLLDP